MFIKQLHTIVEDALYAIEWDSEDIDCLSLFIDKMTDAQYLRSYFKQNEARLAYFQQTRHIKEAVIATIEEAELLAEELHAVAQSGKQYRSGQHLSILFEPLVNNIGILALLILDLRKRRAISITHHGSDYMRSSLIKMNMSLLEVA